MGLGYRLNEYCLAPVLARHPRTGAPTSLGPPIAADSEEDIMHALGLRYVPPEERG